MGKASLLILSLPESIRTSSSFFCFPSGFSRGFLLGGGPSILLRYEDIKKNLFKFHLVIISKGVCSTSPLGGPCYIHLTNETKCHFPLKTRGFQDFCYGNLYLIISFFKLLITIIFHVGDIKAPPIRVTLSCQFYFFLT